LISPSAQSQYTFFCSHLLVQSISETGVQLLIEKENNNDDDDDDDNIMRLKLNLKIPSRYMT
jgi:mannose/fructose/N-acetylgalactosamine-specific phosphotransferase system component IID